MTVWQKFRTALSVGTVNVWPMILFKASMDCQLAAFATGTFIGLIFMFSEL
jgi:hypothetical protein